MRLGLVVPVFDETARVAEFVPDLLAFMGRQKPGSELVFVDDGSSDGTPNELERLLGATTGAQARVLRRPHRGKGAAVATGLRDCVTELRAFCDLDLSTPLSDLSRIVEAAGRADVLAIGSRDLTGSVLVEPQGKLRESLGRLYNRLMQATVTPGVVDTQCGAKAASAAVWSRLLPRCGQTGFAWDAELVAVALSLGVVVQEVPIAWSHDARSRVRVVRDGLAMVVETPRIWRSATRATNAVWAEDQRPLAHDAPAEIFGESNAAQMHAVARTHWWFRSKAAFVATAIRRTDDTVSGRGWLLDAGCGSGAISSMLGWPTDRVIAVEGNKTLISAARHQYGLEAVQASVHQLPVADASVDVVSLLDVVEHLRDPHQALREAKRALRPGGRLVVNVPAHRWLWSEADVTLGHQRRYTRRSLCQELAEVGFEPELLTHVFSWLVPPVWLLRRFARRSQAELGLDRRSLPLDLASLVLTALERAAIGRISLPIGTSVLCVARAEMSDC